MSKIDFSDTIYKQTHVCIDNNALIDDIRKAISTSEMENDERQRITGQDDVMERWEYLVDFHRDEILDDDGELLQVTDTVKVIEITITRAAVTPSLSAPDSLSMRTSSLNFPPTPTALKSKRRPSMEISLKEYAARHSRAAATVRQKAIRGGFKTARRVGRDWLIDEDEPYIDERFAMPSTPPDLWLLTNGRHIRTISDAGSVKSAMTNSPFLFQPERVTANPPTASIRGQSWTPSASTPPTFTTSPLFPAASTSTTTTAGAPYRRL